MPSFDRASGIILHPTSLPGPHGAGDFGPAAYHFIDWLVTAGQSLWQVLPLTPIGPGNSPYASVSAFAGNPLLIDLGDLVQRGWLPPIPEAERRFNPERVDFGRVIPFRHAKLRLAADGFFARATAAERETFAAFCTAEAAWLDDYALFMALDQAHHGRAWPDWEEGLARRKKAALAAARKTHADEIRFWQFVQWTFDRQWKAVKTYANARGVRIVGDLPIFIAHHGADCWARPDLYFLDERGFPTVVAGVPPDFFSATGQRWGNPLYRWDAMKKDGYQWWIDRIQRQLALADIVRIDHFRGFAGYWEIPGDAPTAETGRWKPGPGPALFEAIRAALGDLPIIAEDLGVITPDVVALRDGFGFPGMRVLQFGFADDATNAFLPHNYVANTVVYSGTHDNDTVRGWWATCTEHERAFAARYLRADGHDIHWAMIRAASASVADLALYQLQDVLGLDGYHRMNIPGLTGCWEWRYTWDYVPPDAAQRLAELTALYGRTSLDRLRLPAYPPDTVKP